MRNALLRLLVVSSVTVGLTACGETESASPEPAGWQTNEEFEDPVEAVEEPDIEEPAPDTDPEPEPEPTVVGNPDGAPDGSNCADDSECRGGVCLSGESWPDGYCTHAACEGGCDDGAACIDSGLGNFCAQNCESDDDCRAGYACDYETGSAFKVCVPPVGLPDGSPCEADGDCQGGTCIVDWPGGFCTTVGCDDFTDCARQGNENRCLRRRGPDVCVRICTEAADCRDGYVCEMFGNGEGMCAADTSVPFDPAVLQGNPFDLVCQTPSNGTVSLDFDIDADTTAYMVTPISKDGRRIEPREVSLPGGGAVDLEGANAFQTIAAYQIYGGMNPTVVPATAQFSDQLESGTHTYQLASDSTEVCHYVLQESAPGDTIDLNIYLVDVPGIDSTTAPNHEDMQEVLQQFDDIYASAGVQIGKIRYIDITGTDADRFGVLRSEQDVSELVALSERPGPTMDDVLSINIFFTRAFALGGAIGISLGLPGPAGLHGSHGSGVAFTAEYLGQTVDPSFGGSGVDGNVFTGQILAHEIGHYIGLFHTTESNGFSIDPLPDTPNCRGNGGLSQNCPDITNLMFPFAGESHVEVTADQQFVIQVNPLTKMAPATNDPTNPQGGN